MSVFCVYCGKSTENPKFCNNSCSASYNNKGVVRNGQARNPRYCLDCGKETSRSNSLRCVSCSHVFARQEKISKWLSGEISFELPIGAIRTYISDLSSGKCQICGQPPLWNSAFLRLELDHIDGNWRNNTKENLRLVCPNCHSQTPTFRAKNKKLGRPGRTNQRKK